MDKKTNLSSKGIAAVFWGGFGSLMRAGLQIVTQIILARLLGPGEYGIFAIAAIVLSFSRFFSDIGISYGLIQKKTVSDDDIRFVFTWQIIMGTTVGVGVFLLSEPLAHFFNEPRLVDVLHVAAVICLIGAMTSPSMNLLKRELDFKSIQTSQVSAYIVGYVIVAIPLAVAGLHVWSLIAAFIVNELMVFVLLYRRTRHPIGILFWQREDNQLLGYGLRVFATNILNWIISNVDRVIIGRFFPASQVGLYSVSYNLVSSPTLLVIGVVQSALFSTSAKVQDDFDRLRKALLTMIGAVTLLLFPVFAGIAAVSDTLMLTLYGPSWLDASVLLRAVALAMPLYLLLGMATPLLWVSGQTNKEFLIQIPVALTFIGAAALASQYSMEAVAWTVFGMYLMRSLVIVTVTCHALDLSLLRVLQSMVGGLAVTAVTSAAIYGTDVGMRAATSHPLLWLAADILAGAVSLFGCLLLAPGIVNSHVAELFGKVASKLPAPTDAWLNRIAYRGQLKRST
ncbi:lipopolysaccharide biosynthesis protein [Oxalobacteraceae bacterium OM1]|nr:lipopolysaccharide biosynthesis protein [Oxalobacteraceae bacterium OM1]